MSILLFSTIKIFSSLASFLNDLLKASILLLIPSWAFLIVRDDSAMEVCRDSFFASETISVIVSIVLIRWDPFRYVIFSTLYLRTIRVPSHYWSDIVFNIETCCPTVVLYLYIVSFSQSFFT